MAKATRTKRKTRAHATRTVRRMAPDVLETAARGADALERQTKVAAAVLEDQASSAAAVNKPIVEAVVRAGHQYMACVSELSNDTLALAGERYRHNAEFAQSLAHCRRLQDAMSLQRRWVMQAVEDYVDRAANLARTSTSAAICFWQPLLQADELRT
jgi:hypothetical protein